MSEATTVTALALYNHRGKGKNFVQQVSLSWDRKTAMEGAEVTRSGRLFQTHAAATGKIPVSNSRESSASDNQ